MKRIRILALILAIAALTQNFFLICPPPVNDSQLPNDCLIQAVSCQAEYLATNQLLKDGVWTHLVKVYYISWWHMPQGHALCVFQLPQNGDIYSYDSMNGSHKLDCPPYTHDISRIGISLHHMDSHFYMPGFTDNKHEHSR